MVNWTESQIDFINKIILENKTLCRYNFKKDCHVDDDIKGLPRGLSCKNCQDIKFQTTKSIHQTKNRNIEN